MRRMALTLSTLALLLLASCGGDSLRDGSGAITQAGEMSVFDLRTGDCFDDPATLAGPVEKVPVVPCSDPHDNEIYFAFELPDGDFPGASAVDGAADDRCLTEFEPFVGVGYFDSVLDYFAITPTSGSWDQGDRTVYCVIYELDLSKLVGSARGAGR